MISALEDFQIVGVTTDLGYLNDIIRSEAFLAAEVDTMYLESFQPQEFEDLEALERETAVAATLFIHNMLKRQARQAREAASQWRTVAWREQMAGNF
jgi:acetyl/propionyl-CoA carboxylase alpha subunit